jgi:hypothetical protein
MRRLTVLLDPGRLKRWVSPNIELGPPLKAGEIYTLEIGAGMIDLNGRPLRECFRKHFLVGDPVREQLSVESWDLLPPATDSRQALVLLVQEPTRLGVAPANDYGRVRRGVRDSRTSRH